MVDVIKRTAGSSGDGVRSGPSDCVGRHSVIFTRHLHSQFRNALSNTQQKPKHVE